MANRMCHPSLDDLNYVLNRWQHSWNQALEAAVRAHNGERCRPDTPTQSLRAATESHLFGFPLAPVPPVD